MKILFIGYVQWVDEGITEVSHDSLQQGNAHQLDAICSFRIESKSFISF